MAGRARAVLTRFPGVVATWPLAVKVPLVVMLLMVSVAVVISHVVLGRLGRDQETNLRLLTGAYLDGVSAAVLPAVIRRDVWETFDALDRAHGKYEGVEVRSALVGLPSGMVLASSDPLRIPSQPSVPEPMRSRLSDGSSFVIDEDQGRAWVSRTLSSGGVEIGNVLAEVDITALLRVRREVLTELILVNGALTVGLAAIGYLLVLRMLRPLRVLTRQVDRLRDGRVEPIPEQHSRGVAGEFGSLFDRLNAMARSVAEREALAARLAAEERYSMLGKLASGMAHEVNNPLAGMLNAIDTLEAHGDDRAARRLSLEFLRRGLAGIRSVVRATLVTYKGGEPGVLARADLDDLPFLVQHETGLKRVRLAWRNELPDVVSVDGAAVRQITLNLLLNACAASPPDSTLTVAAGEQRGRLVIAVDDQGPGLPLPMAAVLEESGSAGAPPAIAPGLGLWTTARLVRELRGAVRVERLTPGTRVVVEIPIPVDQQEAVRAIA
jgi:signal transduction histidine kinase